MSREHPLNLFFQAPEGDRWLPFDRYPRWLVRRLVRGRFPRVGGFSRSFHYLRLGLDKIDMPYRVNDYRYLRRHGDETACIYGYPFLLNAHRWTNPIVFGAGGYNHPSEDPDLPRRLPVKKIVVKGAWLRDMCRRDGWGDLVVDWAAGIDTEEWRPAKPGTNKTHDYIVYDKIRWHREEEVPRVLEPVREALRRRGRSWIELRYGEYREEAFKEALRRSSALIFLCEHETQGLAYQQALSCGVPILAWDRGGEWRDPEFYPRIRFGPVTSVPYWDERCGTKFSSSEELALRLDEFESGLHGSRFQPRKFVEENLSLEVSAKAYVSIVREAASS